MLVWGAELQKTSMMRGIRLSRFSRELNVFLVHDPAQCDYLFHFFWDTLYGGGAHYSRLYPGYLVLQYHSYIFGLKRVQNGMNAYNAIHSLVRTPQEEIIIKTARMVTPLWEQFHYVDSTLSEKITQKEILQARIQECEEQISGQETSLAKVDDMIKNLERTQVKISMAQENAEKDPYVSKIAKLERKLNSLEALSHWLCQLNAHIHELKRDGEKLQEKYNVLREEIQNVSITYSVSALEQKINAQQTLEPWVNTLARKITEKRQRATELDGDILRVLSPFSLNKEEGEKLWNLVEQSADFHPPQAVKRAFSRRVRFRKMLCEMLIQQRTRRNQISVLIRETENVQEEELHTQLNKCVEHLQKLRREKLILDKYAENLSLFKQQKDLLASISSSGLTSRAYLIAQGCAYTLASAGLLTCILTLLGLTGTHCGIWGAVFFLICLAVIAAIFMLQRIQHEKFITDLKNAREKYTSLRVSLDSVDYKPGMEDICERDISEIKEKIKYLEQCMAQVKKRDHLISLEADENWEKDLTDMRRKYRKTAGNIIHALRKSGLPDNWKASQVDAFYHLAPRLGMLFRQRLEVERDYQRDLREMSILETEAQDVPKLHTLLDQAMKRDQLRAEQRKTLRSIYHIKKRINRLRAKKNIRLELFLLEHDAQVPDRKEMLLAQLEQLQTRSEEDLEFRKLKQKKISDALLKTQNRLHDVGEKKNSLHDTLSDLKKQREDLSVQLLEIQENISDADRELNELHQQIQDACVGCSVDDISDYFSLPREERPDQTPLMLEITPEDQLDLELPRVFRLSQSLESEMMDEILNDDNQKFIFTESEELYDQLISAGASGCRVTF